MLTKGNKEKWITI